MELDKAFLARLMLLLPIAYCLFLLIESPDKTVRLGAIIALIIFEQAREWLLLSTIRPTNKPK